MLRIHSTTRRRRHEGFTLIEILIVMMIIMILAGMTLGGIALVQRMRDEAKAKVQIGLLATALDGYKAVYGAYPAGDGSATSTTLLRTELYPAEGALEGDKVFLSDLGQVNGQGWGGSGPILDPFKNIGSDGVASAYRYRSPGTHNVDFDLWSFGQDGIENTGDDIKNW
jgi:general secretion pathway protein G